MEYYLITFVNTHAAISAQKFLTGKLSFHVMPTLRELSSSCGISLKIDTSSEEEIRESMKSFPLGKTTYNIYFVSENNIKELY